MQYLKDQWLSVIIIAVLMFFTLSEQQKNNILLDKSRKLEAKILILEQKDHESGKIIDSLSKVDTVIVNRIKIIKQKQYVQIRIIDSLPISGLQRYFTDRYPEK